MELYLTEKVRLGYRTGELIRMVVFALLGVTIAASVFEVGLEFDLGSVLAELFMLSISGLCIWKGTLGPVRHQIASRLAHRLAECFFASSEPEISFDQLSRAIGGKNVERKVRYMIQKGYLENIILDTPNKRIMLTAFNKVAQKEQYETVACPHCGGENVIRPGWASSCQYCGSKLI